MKISVILGHPSQESLNFAIAARARDCLAAMGHEVRFHDLCAEGFDPLLPAPEICRDAKLEGLVALHCREIVEADAIVVVHPNWWGMPPAVLKGWVDRVLRPGVAYEFLEGDGGEGVPNGLLKAKQAVLFNTSNTFPEREARAFGDPLERIWRDCIFSFCGVERFHRRVFTVVCLSTAEERAAWLDQAEADLTRLFGPVDH